MEAGQCGNQNKMATKQLTAGPFTILYENGFLRYVRYGEREIVRMIYFALRDENWGTYQLFIEDESMEILSDSFAIRYKCYHKNSEEKVFSWNVLINASPIGEIVFEIHGERPMNFLARYGIFTKSNSIKPGCIVVAGLCRPFAAVRADLFRHDAQPVEYGRIFSRPSGGGGLGMAGVAALRR